MVYDNAKYSWRKEKENGERYKIYRIIGGQGTYIAETLVPETTICAEGIIQIGNGILMAKEKDETYSLYASNVTAVMQRKKQFGNLHFFIGKIKSFIIFNEQLLLYNTNEGWFFLLLNRAFWNIDNSDILKKRRNMIPKFSDSSDEVVKIKRVAMNKNNFIVYTMKKKIIIFEGENFDYKDTSMYVHDQFGNQYLNFEPLLGEFIEFDRYEPITGCNYTVKIYPDKEDEFYIGSLLRRSNCMQPEILYKAIDKQWKRYFMVSNKQNEQVMVYASDG